MATKLRIDPEFRDLLPKLSDEEKALLRELILKEGCRDPIICWKTNNPPIIDGHHRYEICTAEGIPFQVRLIPFEDRAAVKRWMRELHLARRNYTDNQRAIQRGLLYNETKGAQGGNHAPEKAKYQNDTLLAQPKGTQQDAATAIAKNDGVSPLTVKRDGQFAEAVGAVIEKAPELKEPIERGVIPKAAVAALAEAPPAKLKQLAKLEGPELRKAAQKAAKKAPKNAAKDDTVFSADTAKAQVKIWADTIGRWLDRSPSIDEFRNQFPGDAGDRVVKLATSLYEALKLWRTAIK